MRVNELKTEVPVGHKPLRLGLADKDIYGRISPIWSPTGQFTPLLLIHDTDECLGQATCSTYLKYCKCFGTRIRIVTLHEGLKIFSKTELKFC